MDEDTASLAGAIGVRVRLERRARQWTLDQLAESAGVARRSVINVEQGTANPSVGILLKISDALGIGLPALVSPPEHSRVTVTRSHSAAQLWSGESGGRGTLMTGTAPPDVLELWDWVLEPGERHASEPHADGTHELLHVLDGTVTLEVSSQSFALQVGDAVSFPGNVNHAYANHGEQPARFSLAVHEPGVGATSARGHHA